MNLNLPSHHTRPPSHCRWHRSSWPSVGYMGVRDRTLLQVCQTKGHPEQGSPLCKHQPLNPQDGSAECDLNEVRAEEETHVEGKARQGD